MRNITSRLRGLSKVLLIGALGLVCLIGFQAAAAAQQGSEIEDILYEKGSITKEEWLKIKANRERAQATAKGDKSNSTDLLKGVEIGAVVYLNYTYAMGNSFTGNTALLGVTPTQAQDNRGLASGFHFSRTYLNIRKNFEGGHQFRLTLDQMTNDVGGNSCPNANTSGGNCHEASPFGLAGFAGTGRNNTFVKYAYYDHSVLPGLNVRVGMNQTPWIEYEEHRWTYRFLFPTFVDQQNFQTSSDLGISLMGKVLDKMVDYHVSFQEGEGYQNTPDGRGYAVLGRLSVEPINGVIISAFGHNERLRNGREGFNPQRALANVEFYDPANDRFKVNLQGVWADDGGDIGNPGNPINVPGTYTTGTATAGTANTYGGTNGPATGIPRFHQARGYELWAWYRIPNFEKVRLHGRYYFMKPNKDTVAGDTQSYYVGLSYDYSKYLAFSLDYTVLNQTVLGSGTGATSVGGQSLAAIQGCATCGQFVNYNNQIIGLRALITF